MAYTAGAACLFSPPDERKGSGVREPPDLVWALRDLVLPMWCTQTEPRSADRDAINLTKSIRHNLGQAKGWLARWRSGAALAAENDYGNVHAAFSTNLAVGVISVVDGGAATIDAHPEFATENGVSFAITIPKNSLKLMADHHFSLYDAVYLLRLMYDKIPLRQSPEIFDQMILEYAANAIRLSGCLQHFPKGLRDPQLLFNASIFGLLNGSPSRTPIDGVVLGEGPLANIAPVITDIPLVETLERCSAIETLRAMWRETSRVGCLQVRGIDQDAVLMSVDLRGPNQAGLSMLKRSLDAMKTGRLRAGVVLFFDTSRWAASGGPGGEIHSLASSQILRGTPPKLQRPAKIEL